jgi:hypothetical protein
MLEPVTGYM